ncbi:MAG TPA: porin [Polyangiaceae bacterium]|nr:porin [Polyangiaceae bacterium]
MSRKHRSRGAKALQGRLAASTLGLSLLLASSAVGAQPAGPASLPPAQPPAPLPPAARLPPAAPQVDAPKLEAPKVDTPKAEPVTGVAPQGGAPRAEPSKSGDKAPLVTTAPADGFGLQSQDGDFSLKLRGVVQADSRFFFGSGTNQFLLRRVRPTVDGTVYKFFEYRITAELTATPSALDAYGNVRLIKEAQLRVGKFKVPVGLQRLQNDPDMPFMERGLPSLLVPDRDIGAMLHGEAFDGALAYAIGIFDGAGNGQSLDGDTSDYKDVDGRIFVRPFVPLKVDLVNLGVGIAATRGTQVGPQPRISSPDQNIFYFYADNAVAAGTHRRLAPQGYAYIGPFGLLVEYTRSSQIMTNGVNTGPAVLSAWQVEFNAYLTGEKASYSIVTPRHALDPAKGHWGAVEVAARYGALNVAADVFALGFADPNRVPSSVHEWAVAANWHFARGFQLDVDYEYIQFTGGAKGGDKPTETVLMSRLQAYY